MEKDDHSLCLNITELMDCSCSIYHSPNAVVPSLFYLLAFLVTVAAFFLALVEVCGLLSFGWQDSCSRQGRNFSSRPEAKLSKNSVKHCCYNCRPFCCWAHGFFTELILAFLFSFTVKAGGLFSLAGLKLLEMSSASLLKAWNWPVRGRSMMFLSLMGSERAWARSPTAAKLEDIMERQNERRRMRSVDEPGLPQRLELRLVQPYLLVAAVEEVVEVVVEEVTVDVDVVHPLADDDLLRVGSQRLLVLRRTGGLLRPLGRAAQAGEGAGCVGQRAVQPLLELRDTLAQRLAHLFVDEADYLADGLVELGVYQVHVPVQAGGNGLDLLVGPEYLAGVQRDRLLQLPQAPLHLLHPLVRRACFGGGFHCFLEEGLHFLAHPFLALVDEFGVQLLLHLHLAGQNVPRPVILELLPEFADAVIQRIHVSA